MKTKQEIKKEYRKIVDKIISNKPITQCEKIFYNLVNNRHLTLSQLMQMYIANHTARITQLRNKGFDIICTKLSPTKTIYELNWEGKKI